MTDALINADAIVHEAGSAFVLNQIGDEGDKVYGPFRVVKTFTRGELADAYAMAWKLGWRGTADTDDADPIERADQFTNWLFEAGYLQEMPEVTVWHIDTFTFGGLDEEEVEA